MFLCILISVILEFYFNNLKIVRLHLIISSWKMRYTNSQIDIIIIIIIIIIIKLQ